MAHWTTSPAGQEKLQQMQEAAAKSNRTAAKGHYSKLKEELVGTTIAGIKIDDLVIEESENASDRCWVLGQCEAQGKHWAKVRLASLRYTAKHGGTGCAQCRNEKSSARAPVSFRCSHQKVQRFFKLRPSSIEHEGEWYDLGTIVMTALKIDRTRLRSLSRPGWKIPATIHAIEVERFLSPGEPAFGKDVYYLRSDWEKLQEKIKRRLSKVQPAAATALPATGVLMPEDWQEGAIIDGRRKQFTSFAAFKLLRALKSAGDRGMTKDEIEEITSDARPILRRLREDPAWAKYLVMAGTKGGRYRML